MALDNKCKLHTLICSPACRAAYTCMHAACIR